MEIWTQHFTTALGWSIVHSLWQGAAMYTLLCFMYVAFPKAKAKHKYAIAYAGQVGILVAFLTTFAYYLNTFGYTGTLGDVEANVIFILAETTHTFATIDRVVPWFASAYVIGLLLQLIFFGKSFSKLRYLRRAGLSEVPMDWLVSFHEIKGKLQLSKPIQFYLSAKISVPLVLGYLKPLVLFPLAYANHMDIRHVESILLHELAHVKRNDYLFNLVKVCIETVLFFNPFVWLISRLIETEREHACDDIVVEQIPSPITYAQALMSLEVLRQEQGLSFTMAIAGKKQHLLHRIKRITKMEKNYINVKQHLFAIVIGSLAFMAIAWAVPQETRIDQTFSPIGQYQELNYLMPSVGQPIHEQILAVGSESFIANGDIQNQQMVIATTNRDTISKEINSKNSVEQKIIKFNFDTIVPEIHFDSEEWRENMAKIQVNTQKLEEYFNSPAWKEKVAKIEIDAKKIEEYYNSPEWKEKMAKIQINTQKLEEYFNSPEWKEKTAKMEINAKKIGEYYNSPEWKEKMAKIQVDTKKLEEYFNSAEWKEKMAKIEIDTKKISEYFDSPEWKEKMQQITELYNSEEYKAIQRKYEKEVENLQLKKGLR